MYLNIRRFWPLLFVSLFIFIPKMTFAAGWTNIGFADKNVKTVYVDPKNNLHILVSLAVIQDNSYNFYTENGGSTWTPVNMGGAVTPCNNFTINPRSTNEVWAGCNVGLFRSIDGGKNFSVIPKYLNMASVNVSISADGTIYIASPGNNFHRSVDGIVWEVLRPPSEIYQPSVFLNKFKAGEVYISTQNGLYKSADSGINWILLSGEPTIRKGINQMTFDSTGKICASIGTLGISCSIDGGFTWPTIASPNITTPNEYQHFYNLAQNPDDDANLLILAGTWGGLDMKLYGYTAGVSVPTVSTMSQSVNGITISQGVVYTWASTSSWAKGIWRNDGIAVVPEYLKKHPVIIVPGILGSWNVPFKNSWELDPIKGTYDDLYNNFVNAGYEPDKYLFTFPYQWRNDNKYTAALLANKIIEVKQKSGATKVDIVAHSMGGIVTRLYAESDIYDNDINKIFFLGTPHLGSSSSYPLWSAGYTGFEEAYFGMLLSFILHEEALVYGYKGENAEKNYVQNNVPSIGQLLPVYSYLNSSVYPVDHPENNLLSALNESKDILSSRGVAVVNIIGDTGPTTLQKFTVTGSTKQPSWDFGEPIGLNSGSIYTGVEFEYGDGTVTTESQGYIPGKSYILDGVSHGELPKMSVKTVFSELGISNNILITEAINKLLMIKAYSPVDFYVLAPDGKKIGYNPAGDAFNEIPGAFYTGNSSETEFLTIPNPLPGEYKVITTGTGEDSYEIEATYADDESNSTISSSYVGDALPGKEDQIVVDFAPETGTIETKIYDITSPITSFSVSGSKVGEYYNTDVSATLSAEDIESGIMKTEYSLDGVVWQDYSSPIVIIGDGEKLIIYRSVDKSGNVEADQSQLIKIDKTAPSIEVDMKVDRLTHWDSLALNCFAEDNYSGIKSFVVKLDGAEIDCGKPVGLFGFAIGSHQLEYTAIDYADNVSGGVKLFTVIATYESTVRDIWWLYKNHNIEKRGDAIKLASELVKARFEHHRGRRHHKKEPLEHIWKDLNDMKRKNKITSYAYDMIAADINFILEGK